ncbi:MAG: hypothetical protein EBU88_13160 [Acidobacteria bacterium]|nr:hypothetical protein [Acidobacteriota bacterium]
MLTNPGAQQVLVGQLLSISVSGTDPDQGQTLDLTATGVPAGAEFTALGGSGQLNWVPGEAQTGSYEVVLTLRDSGSPQLTVTTRIKITVIQGNRAPTITAPLATVANLLQPLSFVIVATDPDSGQSVNLTAAGLPAGATFAATGGRGEFKWTPGETQSGSYRLSFTARDNGLPQMAETKMVVVTVVAGNRGPLLMVPEPMLARSGQAISLKVMGTDPDVGQTVSLTATGLPSGATFASTGETGLMTWTPGDWQAGVYTIDFKVTDNGTPPMSETKRLVITVVQSNRPPIVVVPAPRVVPVGVLTSFTVSGTDPDTGQVLSLSASGIPPGANFTATGGTGQFSWQPAPGQSGSYTMSFTVRDNGLPQLNETARMVITVIESQTPLVLSPMNFTTGRVSDEMVVTRYAGVPARKYEEDLGEGLKLEMVALPAGSFMMGSPLTDPDRGGEEGPPHQVLLGAFLLGKYEVTQSQWQAMMGSNPSSFSGSDLPVDNVSWEQAQEFCQRINQKLGLNAKNGYRLPTEAEWEYAVRAGSSTSFAFGKFLSTEIVNHHSHYLSGVVPTGSLGVANAWGLYDMHGNVWEWCEDDYHGSYVGAPLDGRAWSDIPRSAYRVFRGGAFNELAVRTRSSVRNYGVTSVPYPLVGFRLARTLP